MYDPGELTALHDHKLIALFVTFAALAFHWWNTYQARPESMR
jgi:hypothetical protein